MTLVLSDSDVSRIIEMPDVIAAIERAHAEDASGRAAQPQRTNFGLPDRVSALIQMPAFIAKSNAIGIKILSHFPGNKQFGFPAQSSTVLIFDSDTGQCKAILAGGHLTAYRTGAASAVATKFLARPDSGVLGLVGAGRLARTHLEAIRSVRPLEKVLVWSRTKETVGAFMRSAENVGFPIVPVASPEEVVRQCDILCTLTPAKQPIVRGTWFRKGLHINAVGCPPMPDHREIDTEGFIRSRIVVDSREAVLETGDVLIPLQSGDISRERVADEIGEIINGTKVGRTDNDQVTLYKSVGVAIQDIATAMLVVNRAKEAGVGLEVEL